LSTVADRAMFGHVDRLVGRCEKMVPKLRMSD
jgi:hypothetical protein